MVECMYCKKSNTHRVCDDCFNKMEFNEEDWCPICGEPADLPIHDWECFK